MEVQLKKQAQKYLDRVDQPTREKLLRALDQLALLQGDIKPLKGQKNIYRYKLEHYRMIFEWSKDATIVVISINTRTNTKY